MSDVTELDKLCQKHREYAEVEKKAKQNRIEVENIILQITDSKEEGTCTTKTRYFKCSTVGKLTRSLDPEVWANIKDDIPEDLQPVKVKESIDLPKLRAIESANPDLFKFISKAISTKPAKTQVKVELL
jgi:hypothetical protein|tara:strand:+ start:4494 stop:4880 length:387 start_codon:yes stop_codon:yes gene_type:complete